MYIAEIYPSGDTRTPWIAKQQAHYANGSSNHGSSRHTSWLGSKTWMAKSDLIGGTHVILGSYLLCDGGYHKWPCLVYPKKKAGLPGSHKRKWCGLIESIRKDIEGTYGMLKKRFAFLKYANRLHCQSDIDNAFVVCCILHNMLLKDNGFLDLELPLIQNGLTAKIRKLASACDGLRYCRDDDTPDPIMDEVERQADRSTKL